MFNNYFRDTVPNTIDSSKTYKDKLDQNSIICNQILVHLKEELDTLNSKKMVEDYIYMKNTIFEELSKKLGESSINNIREFLEKNLDIQLDFFIQCFQLVEKKKMDIFNLVSSNLTKIKKKTMISPKNNININNNIINNSKSNVIDDHEFVATLNLLSSNIKEFHSDQKKDIEALRSNNDSLIEALLSIKNQFVEYSNMVCHNSFGGGGYKVSKTNSSNEASACILGNLNKVIENKHLISSNIKSFDKRIILFYDKSKSIFKTLKSIQISNSTSETNYMLLNNIVRNNFNIKGDLSRNQNKSINVYKNIQSPLYQTGNSCTKDSFSERNKPFFMGLSRNISIPKTVSSSINPIFQSIDLLNQRIDKEKNIEKERNLENINQKTYEPLDVTRRDNNIIKEENKKKQRTFSLNNIEFRSSSPKEVLFSENKNSSQKVANLQENDIKIRHNKASSNNFHRDQFQLVDDSKFKPNLLLSKEINSKVLLENEKEKFKNIDYQQPIIKLIKLCKMVINFINEIANLQESITKKANNIKELKQAFETNKAELYKFSKECYEIYNKYSNLSKISGFPQKTLTKKDSKNILEQKDGFHQLEPKENYIIPQIKCHKSFINELLSYKIEITDNFSKLTSQDSTNLEKYENLQKKFSKLEEDYKIDKENFNNEINCLNKRNCMLSSENCELKNRENCKKDENANKKSLIELENKKLEDEKLLLISQIGILNTHVDNIKKENDESKNFIDEIKQKIEENKVIFLKNENKNIDHIKKESDVKTKILNEIICFKDNITEKTNELKKLKNDQELSKNQISSLINENITLNITINTLRENILEIKDLLKMSDSSKNEINEKNRLIENLQNETKIMRENLAKSSDMVEISIKKLHDENLEKNDLIQKFNNLKIEYHSEKLKLQNQLNDKIKIIYELQNKYIELQNKNLDLNKANFKSENNESLIKNLSESDNHLYLNNEIQISNMKSINQDQNLKKEIPEIKFKFEVIDDNNILIGKDDKNLPNELYISNNSYLIKTQEINKNLQELEKRSILLEKENSKQKHDQLISDTKHSIKLTELNNKIIQLEKEKKNLLEENIILKNEKESYKNQTLSESSISTQKIMELEDNYNRSVKENEKLNNDLLDFENKYKCKYDELRKNIQELTSECSNLRSLNEKLNKGLSDQENVNISNKNEMNNYNEIIERQSKNLCINEKKLFQIEINNKNLLDSKKVLEKNLINAIDMIKYICDSLYKDDFFNEIIKDVEEEDLENHKNFTTLIADLNENNLSEVISDVKLLSTCLNSLLFMMIQKQRNDKIQITEIVHKESISIIGSEIKTVKKLENYKKEVKNFNILEKEMHLKQVQLEENNKVKEIQLTELSNKLEKLKIKSVLLEKKYTCFFNNVLDITKILLSNLNKNQLDIELNYKIENEETSLLSLLKQAIKKFDRELCSKTNLLKKSSELNKIFQLKLEESFKNSLEDCLQKERVRTIIEVKKENQSEIDQLKHQLNEYEIQLKTVKESFFTNNNIEIIEGDNNIEENKIKINKKEKEIESLKEKIDEIYKINDEINNQLLINDEKLKVEKENHKIIERELQNLIKLKEIEIKELLIEFSSFKSNHFEIIKKIDEEKNDLKQIIDQFLKEKEEQDIIVNAEITKEKKEREELQIKYNISFEAKSKTDLEEDQKLSNFDPNIIEKDNNLIIEKNKLLIQIEVMKTEHLSQIMALNDDKEKQIKIISENLIDEINNLKNSFFHKEVELNDCKLKLLKSQKQTHKYSDSGVTQEILPKTSSRAESPQSPKISLKKSKKIMTTYKAMTKRELKNEIENLINKISQQEDEIKYKIENYNILEIEYSRKTDDLNLATNKNKELEKLINQHNNKISELEMLVNDCAKYKIELKLKNSEIISLEKNLKNLYIKIKESDVKNDVLISYFSDEKKKGLQKHLDSVKSPNLLIEKYLSENKSTQYYLEQIFSIFDFYNQNLNENIKKIKNLENEVIEKKTDLLLSKELINYDDLKKELNVLFYEDVTKEFNQIYQFIINNNNNNLDTMLINIQENYIKISICLTRLIKILTKSRDQNIDNNNKIRNPEQIFYDPKKYRIYCYKTAFNIKWCLLVYNRDNEKMITSNDMEWVIANSLKLDNYEHINNISFEKEKELLNLQSVQVDLLNKLSSKEEEISSYKHQLNKNNKTISLEKYEKILNQLNQEQQDHLELYKNYELLKRENEIIKLTLLNKSNENVKQNNISEIDNFNSKFIEDVADVNDIFIETQYENINKDTLNNQNDSNLLENPIKNHKNLYYKNHCGILSSENAHQVSFKRKPEDSLNEKITKIEEIEKFYTDQIKKIKDELGDLRIQRDNYKKLYESSLTIKDEKKNELIFLLRQTIDKLVVELTLTGKAKELLIILLKMIDYSEDEISDLLSKKEGKKKSFLGSLFGGNK